MTFAYSYCTFATQEYFTTHTHHELMESNITTLYRVMIVPKKIKTIYCRFFLLFIRHTLHNSLYLYYNQCWLIFYFVRWLSSIMDTICYSDILQTTMSSISTRLQDIEPSCSH